MDQFTGRIKTVEHCELTKTSLGYLVDLLVSLDFSTRDLITDGNLTLPHEAKNKLAKYNSIKD